MTIARLLQSLPSLLRQPSGLAILASLALHAAIVPRLIDRPARARSPVERPVEVVTLSPEERDRLPDFFTDPGGAIGPDGELLPEFDLKGPLADPPPPLDLPPLGSDAPPAGSDGSSSPGGFGWPGGGLGLGRSGAGRSGAGRSGIWDFPVDGGSLGRGSLGRGSAGRQFGGRQRYDIPVDEPPPPRQQPPADEDDPDREEPGDADADRPAAEGEPGAEDLRPDGDRARADADSEGGAEGSAEGGAEGAPEGDDAEGDSPEPGQEDRQLALQQEIARREQLYAYNGEADTGRAARVENLGTVLGTWEAAIEENLPDGVGLDDAYAWQPDTEPLTQTLSAQEIQPQVFCGPLSRREPAWVAVLVRPDGAIAEEPTAIGTSRFGILDEYAKGAAAEAAQQAAAEANAETSQAFRGYLFEVNFDHETACEPQAREPEPEESSPAPEEPAPSSSPAAGEGARSDPAG